MNNISRINTGRVGFSRYTDGLDIVGSIFPDLPAQSRQEVWIGADENELNLLKLKQFYRESLNNSQSIQTIQEYLKFLANKDKQSKPVSGLLYWFPLTANLNPIIGSGTTSTFTRSNAAAFFNVSTGFWEDGTHQNARFERSKFKTERNTTCYPNNFPPVFRDLTNAAYTKTDCTAVKNAIGIDGVANSCSTLTATANNATCLAAITLTANTRTFAPYIRRKTGTGTIELTVDGGTNWVNVTSQINSSSFSRPCIVATAANPTIGIRLGTSGDEIEVDCCYLEQLGTVSQIPSSPCLSRADRGAETLTISGFSFSKTRRAVELEIEEINAGGFGIRVGNSGLVQNVSAGISQGISFFNISINNGSLILNFNNSTDLSLSLPIPPINYGIPFVFRMEWGFAQLKILVNSIPVIDFDLASTTEPAVDRFSFSASTPPNILCRNLKIEELDLIGNVVLLGDSITARLNGTEGNVPNKGQLDSFFSNNFPAYIFRNRGVGSETLVQIDSRVAADVTPYYYSQIPNNIVVVWGGTNDLTAGASGSTIVSRLQTLVDSIKTGNSGWKVIVCNILPRAGITESAQTARTIFNQSFYTVTGVDKFIDVASIPGIQNPFDASIYDDALVHPLDKAYLLILPYIANAIVELTA